MTDAVNSRVARFQTNEANVDAWVKGGAGTSVDFGGGPVRSPAKLIADMASYIADIAGFKFEATDYPALRAYTGPLRTVTVVGQGIAGVFTRDDSDTTSGDNGGTIIVASNGKRWKRQVTGKLNVLWFGADPLGVANSTDAFTRCQSAAMVTTNKNRTIQIPTGQYLLSEFQWNDYVSLEGDEVGNAQLIYGGAGGASSYVVGLAATGTGVAVPYNGFKNLTVIGWKSGGAIAENCFRNLGTSLDWGFKLDNVQCMFCFGDAFKLSFTGGKQFINLHLNRVRVDGCGGWGIDLSGNSTNSGCPFSLDQFTYDNATNNSAFDTAATAAGYYDGTRWGYGLLKMEDCQASVAKISRARIEVNRKLKDYGGVTSLIYCNNTVASGYQVVSLDTITGTGRSDQSINLAHDTQDKVTFEGRNITMSGIAKRFSTVTKSREIISSFGGPCFSQSNLQRQQGVMLGGSNLEFRTTPPERGSSIFHTYKLGDMILNSAQGAGKPKAWRVQYPATGFAYPQSANITTSAVVTAGSAQVTVSSGAVASFPPGLAIVLNGAGASGANLQTSVLSVDDSTNQITVANTPSTSVSPCTITYDSALSAPEGYQDGSVTIGDTNTTATLGTTALTLIFNTPLTAARTVTLSTSSTALGTPSLSRGTFRIVRTAAATGASTLSVGGLKTLAAGQWADAYWDGAAWSITASGSL